ncbi:MAG: 1-acyl-sn-glycerol-3-phosphate acyltransferase [Candidatus Gastranaerophilales bacterium]|nr:1-acyl-sn-glycerol-3-phosphate acyltransferase [Candidatus Gastranaerophilales bacterium]
MAFGKLTRRDYNKKAAKDFNILTWLYQIYALRVLFIPFIALPFYKFKLSGNRKALIDTPCIIASNHVSYFDPFIVSWISNRKLAFMAKKELFEQSAYVARNIRRLGGFAVNREKLEVSTIKSVREVFRASWNLCIFPQGGIRKNKKIETINKGFVVLAKMYNADIIPVSISGLEKYNWNVFKKPVIEVKMGEPISHDLDGDLIIENWRKQVAKMAGYELVEIPANSE